MTNNSYLRHTCYFFSFFLFWGRGPGLWRPGKGEVRVSQEDKHGTPGVFRVCSVAPRVWGSGRLQTMTDGQGVEWPGGSELQGQQLTVASGPGSCSLNTLPRRGPVCGGSREFWSAWGSSGWETPWCSECRGHLIPGHPITQDAWDPHTCF